MPAENITLTALWQINQYTITFNNTGDTIIEDIIKDYNENIDTVEDPLKDGYIFIGWDINIPNKMPAENLEIEALWEALEYKLSYRVLDDSYPTEDTFLEPGKKVQEIATGYHFTTILTTHNRVFSWGSNYNGELGNLGNKINNNPYPKEVTFELNEGEKVIKIYEGYKKTVAVTSAERIFMWGENIYLSSINRAANKYYPVDVTENFSLNQNETIIEFSIGYKSTKALTSEGRVLHRTNNTASNPYSELTVLYDYLDEDETIIKIIVSSNVTAFFTSQNKVFMWGQGESIPDGGGKNSTVSNPKDVTSFFTDKLDQDDKIISVDFSITAGIALSEKGKVFTWGQNFHRQLGSGNEMDSFNDIIDITSNFNLTQGDKIIKINTGRRATSAISEQGKLFMWGNNKMGLVGTGNMGLDYYLSPVSINSSFNLDMDEYIVDIKVFDNHIIAKTSKNEIYTWGSYLDHIGNPHLPTGNVTTPVKPSLHYQEEVFSEKLTYNDAINLYEPIKEGYTFIGWYIDTTLETEFTLTNMPAEDIVLYAKFIEE